MLNALRWLSLKLKSGIYFDEPEIDYKEIIPGYFVIDDVISRSSSDNIQLAQPIDINTFETTYKEGRIVMTKL